MHPSPDTPPPMPGKDPKYVWLVTDQGGREVVASCQQGFPDPKLPSRRLFSESLGWGSGPSCLCHSHSVAPGLCSQVLLIQDIRDGGLSTYSSPAPTEGQGWRAGAQGFT